MKRNKPIYLSVSAVLLLFVFVGCTHQPSPSNTNTTNQSNASLNQEVNVNINTTANTNTNSGQEVDTSDWLTYTNEEYGFRFQYPDGSMIEENENVSYGGNITFLHQTSLSYNKTPSEAYSLDFSITDLDFETLINRIEQSDTLPTGQSLAEVYGIEKITIHGLQATRGFHERALGIPSVFYYISLEHSGNSLFVSFNDTNETKIIEEIIGTIKLNEPKKVNWKTYQNTTHQYSIQYPDSTPYINERYAGDQQANTITHIGGGEYGETEETSSSVSIGWGPDSFLRIDIFSKQAGDSLVDFIESQIEVTNSYNALTRSEIEENGEEITVANVQGYAFSTENCCLVRSTLIEGEARYVYLVDPNQTKIYKLYYPITNASDDHDIEHSLVFEEMVNTFDLTNQYRTFTDDKIDFTFEYPAEWEVDEVYAGTNFERVTLQTDVSVNDSLFHLQTFKDITIDEEVVLDGDVKRTILERFKFEGYDAAIVQVETDIVEYTKGETIYIQVGDSLVQVPAEMRESEELQHIIQTFEFIE